MQHAVNLEKDLALASPVFFPFFYATATTSSSKDYTPFTERQRLIIHHFRAGMAVLKPE